jgi:hypothetical protein
MGREFDEEAAAKAVAELAATTDLELTEAIWATTGTVRLAWDVFSSGPGYPPETSPIRGVTDNRGAAVARMITAMAAVAPDDLAGAIRAASHVLGEFFPRTTPAEAGVSDAVEQLRYVAMTRPAQVRDARTIMRGRGA